MCIISIHCLFYCTTDHLPQPLTQNVSLSNKNCLFFHRSLATLSIFEPRCIHKTMFQWCVCHVCMQQKPNEYIFHLFKYSFEVHAELIKNRSLYFHSIELYLVTLFFSISKYWPQFLTILLSHCICLFSPFLMKFITIFSLTFA